MSREDRPKRSRPGDVPRNSMPERPAKERTADFSEVALGYSAQTAILEASRCLQCKKPLCVEGCPVGIDIPGFIADIARGNPLAASNTLRLTTDLPAICGRVCPQESQCEQLCIMGRKFEPVAIGALERFAADEESRSGSWSIQPSRAGDTREMLHAVLEIEEPRERWVVSRQPVMNPAFAIAEALWTLSGSNDAGIMNYWFPRLPEFAGMGPFYDGAYGHRLRKHFGVDQINRACDVLTANPSSRQVVLQLWDVGTDLPNADGVPRSQDVPCNVVALLKVRDGRLEWSQVMRSNDLFRGLPHDIVQFTILQEVLAGWIGVDVGRYFHVSDSLHLYTDQLSQFTCTDIAALSPNTDSLMVDPVRGGSLISELFTRMDILTKADLSEADVAEADAIDDAPAGYKNMLHLLAAESARRRGQHDHAEELMKRCTNPQLFQIWTMWRNRTGNTTPDGSLNAD